MARPHTSRSNSRIVIVNERAANPESGAQASLSPEARDADVLVVGAGPTGLAVANLLAARGVRVLVVERNATTSDEAKAISLDDESLRSLQIGGLAEAIHDIVVPGTGTRYYGRRGQLLAHVHGRQGHRRLGHPVKSAFAQPDLERVLREGLDRYPHVQQQFGTPLTAIEARPDAVAVQLGDAVGAATRTVLVDYVLGCDGGRSSVRNLLNIDMAGRSFDESWLVIDTLNDPHDERYAMHHGDPARPHVIVPGRGGRCRYEFLVQPDEAVPGERPPLELMRRLVALYRPLDAGDVEWHLPVPRAAGRPLPRRTLLPAWGCSAHDAPLRGPGPEFRHPRCGQLELEDRRSACRPRGRRTPRYL